VLGIEYIDQAQRLKTVIAVVDLAVAAGDILDCLYVSAASP